MIYKKIFLLVFLLIPVVKADETDALEILVNSYQKQSKKQDTYHLERVKNDLKKDSSVKKYIYNKNGFFVIIKNNEDKNNKNACIELMNVYGFLSFERTIIKTQYPLDNISDLRFNNDKVELVAIKEGQELVTTKLEELNNFFKEPSYCTII